MSENDDGNVDGTQYGELVSFLEETTFALQKGPTLIKSVTSRQIDRIADVIFSR